MNMTLPDIRYDAEVQKQDCGRKIEQDLDIMPLKQEPEPPNFLYRLFHSKREQFPP